MLVMILAFTSVACLRSPEARRAEHLGSGKANLEKRDYQRAILEFLNAIEAAPQDPEPYYQLGLAYLGAGDVSKAVPNFRKAATLNPRHTGAQLKLAELMMASRNQEYLEEAQKRVQEVLKAAPDNPDALDVLALTELQLGQPDQAEQHLRQALEKYPRHLKSTITLASMKMARKDINGAEAVLNEAARQDPRSAFAVVALGEFYLSTERPSEAEGQFRRALEMDPNNAPALIYLARAAVSNGPARVGGKDLQARLRPC